MDKRDVDESGVTPGVDDSENAKSSTVSQFEARGKSRMGRILLAIVGMTAGCLSAVVVNHQYPSDSDAPFPRVGLTVEETNLLRADPNDPVAHAINRKNSRDAYFKNGAFSIALFAVICGAMLGFVDGILCRSFIAALLTSLVCALLGLLSGLLAGLDVAFFSLKLESLVKDSHGDPTLLTLAMHSSILAIVGGAIGIGLAMVTRTTSAILRCAAGGLVAGLLFLPLATFLFPLQQTNTAIPEQLLPKTLMFVVAGGLIGFSAGRTSQRKQQTEPASIESEPHTATA